MFSKNRQQTMKIKVKCSRCGKEFYKSKFLADLTDNHYCNIDCRDNGNKPKKSYKFE